MTVWLLHQTLTPEEEKQIRSRDALMLPFAHLPDLSLISSPIECRHLLQALEPEAPPEVVARKTERIWKLYAALQVEDIIVVPLQQLGELAVAEVTQRYRYAVGQMGDDVHQVVVKWHDKRLKRRLRKYNELFALKGEKMREVSDVETRTAIRDTLPYKYNRFAKWKWLLLIFFLMGLLRQLQHVVQ